MSRTFREGMEALDINIQGIRATFVRAGEGAKITDDLACIVVPGMSDENDHDKCMMIIPLHQAILIVGGFQHNALIFVSPKTFDAIRESEDRKPHQELDKELSLLENVLTQ